jgi:hypothetical protein
MWIRRVAFAAAACALLGTSAGAKTTRMVGSVASVTSSSLEVLTKNEGVKRVRLDARTEYMRWVTQKPWQSGGEIGFSSLNAGRCVEVDLRSGAGDEAKTVWINTDPTGSMGDPCHTFQK